MRISKVLRLFWFLLINVGAGMFRKKEVYGNRIIPIGYVYPIIIGFCDLYRFRNYITLWDFAKAFRFKVVNRVNRPIFYRGWLYNE
ncbi:MAG: hypothetical protein WAW23_02050 [Candidatus Methanoperedens sp.]